MGLATANGVSADVMRAEVYPVLPLLLCLVPCSCDQPWEDQDNHWLKENVEIHGIDQNPAWNPEPGPVNLKLSCQDNHRWEGKCLLKAPVFWGWWWFAMWHYLSNGWLIHHLTLWAKQQGTAFWFEWPLSGCRFCVLHCSIRFPDERLWICSLLVWHMSTYFNGWPCPSDIKTQERSGDVCPVSLCLFDNNFLKLEYLWRKGADVWSLDPYWNGHR